MSNISWMREALNTAHTQRTGRPFLNLLKMCGAIGSNAAETAAVLGVTLEELHDIVAGQAIIGVPGADRLRMYLELLWWYHCFRLDREEAKDPALIQAVFLRARPIWEEIPRELADGWADAHRRFARREDADKLL